MDCRKMGCRNFSASVLFLAFVGLTLSCQRGRVFAGPQNVDAQGVRISGSIVRRHPQFVGVGFFISNDLNTPIEVNRNQIAVVGADGIDHYRAGTNELVFVAPRTTQEISLRVVDPNPQFTQAPGYYVRLDGVYAGQSRVHLPPIRFGEPVAQPKPTNNRFVATGRQVPTAPPPPIGQPPRGGILGSLDNIQQRFQASLRGGRSNTPNASTTTASTTVAAAPMNSRSAPPANGGVQQYYGSRRQLKKINTKCAAMPLKSTDLPKDTRAIVDELLLAELQQAGFEAIGPDDINSMLGFEKTKDALGCDAMNCAAEIGNALGVEFLAAGNIATIEKSTVLTLKLIDVRSARVLGRVSKMSEGGHGALPRLIGEAVQELVLQTDL